MQHEFSRQIVEKYSKKNPYFIWIRLVGAELFYADGNDKVNNRNFANAPKIDKVQFTTRARVAISTTFLQINLLTQCTYQ